MAVQEGTTGMVGTDRPEGTAVSGEPAAEERDEPGGAAPTVAASDPPGTRTAVVGKPVSHPAPKPRVAFLDHCALESGAELALARLVPACRDIDPVVILGEDGPLVGLLQAEGIEVRVVAMDATTRSYSRTAVVPGLRALRAAFSTAGYSLRLAALLRRLRVDVVATNSLKSSLYGGVAGRLARIPVVWHVRDRIADDYLPTSAVQLVRRAVRFLPRAVIANSATTLATLELSPASSSRLRAQVIGDPCPAELFARPRVANDVLTVGLVGRISPWKGQEVFLRAFALAFPADSARARIIGGPLFGEESLVDQLKDLAVALGVADRVTFVGHVRDVPAELAALDIMVHASTIPEPFGQVVVEAMAAGVPVVATDAGGPAEVVTDGVDGVLYPMGDPEALAQALRRLADDPEARARLADEGRRTAARYAPERIAAQVQEVYRSVLSS
jgi:glycosyltransferase involved in cell wall biosynthesis